MDGLKKRLNESVQLKLSFTLALAILAAALVAGAFSFLSAFEEAHELQDDVLRQVARLVDRRGLSPAYPASGARVGHDDDGDDDSRVIVQRLSDGTPSAQDGDDGGPLPLSPALADGLHTLDAGGETYRVLVRTTAAGERIAVAQEAGLRDEIARDGALRSVLPFLVLVPVLLLIVADLVRKMFRPIAALSREIDQRAEQALHPIDDSRLPVEVRPFAVAINRLLGRVKQSIHHQRRFVADAAHELRTPLTALSLQAQRLADADMSPAAHERLSALRQGIERGRKLLDQLLTLARVQSVAEPPGAPVSVQGIYRRVLEDLMPLAEAKGIDIGVEGTLDAQVRVSELDMIALVKNLVDNAIRYTPPGGRVDLSLEHSGGRVALRVRDNGPGIPLEERIRVFDPFYRTPGSEPIGSGLGLSIVQAVAHRIGADIHLAFTDPVNNTGLSASIRLAAEETDCPGTGGMDVQEAR